MLEPELVEWMEAIELRLKNLETQLNGKIITISGASEIIEGFENTDDMSIQIVYDNHSETKEIQADEKLMRQIITNLISNVIPNDFHTFGFNLID